MAENILETRILLRYATYSQWMNSEVILKQGEAAIATFPNRRTIVTSNDMPDNTPPAIGIKIGDGQHYFYELPWVQAIAADVYTWAKESTKPSYSANEIQGLYEYIQNYAPSGGGSSGETAEPRTYQIVRGTDENINKYYLQYQDDPENDVWITDYNHYIDVDAFVKIANWIGNDVNNFASLGNRTEDHIQYDLQRLTVNDSESGSRVVTAVSQTNGKIEVTKRTLTVSDISGTIGVDRGGTGKTSLTEDEVLVGNGTNPVRQVAIDTEVAQNNHLVTNYAIKQYVDNAVAGIEGAMHFRGDATIEPVGNVDPRASDYNFAHAQPGDVVLWEYKEYVWTGSVWRLLGDEGSYAIKGSIVNADIAADAEIAQSKVNGLSESFQGKVDKVEGKQLSTNDYTNEEKRKLANIEDYAQENVIEHVFLNDSEIAPTTVSGLEKSIDLHFNGMTVEQGEKLDAIEEGAQVNVIEEIQLNGTTVPPVNKVVNLEIHELTEQELAHLAASQENVIEHIYYDGNECIPDENKTVSIIPDPHTEHINKIEHILVNGQEFYPQTVNNVDKTVNLILDDTVLQLNAITGARYPTGTDTYTDINVTNKKLELSHLAATGDVQHLLQERDTYIILNCGSSTDVV